MQHVLKHTDIFVLHSSIKMRPEVLNYIYWIISQASQASPKKNIVFFVRLFVVGGGVLFRFSTACKTAKNAPVKEALQEIARDKANWRLKKKGSSLRPAVLCRLAIINA